MTNIGRKHFILTSVAGRSRGRDSWFCDPTSRWGCHLSVKESVSGGSDW